MTNHDADGEITYYNSLEEFIDALNIWDYSCDYKVIK